MSQSEIHIYLIFGLFAILRIRISFAIATVKSSFTFGVIDVQHWWVSRRQQISIHGSGLSQLVRLRIRRRGKTQSTTMCSLLANGLPSFAFSLIQLFIAHSMYNRKYYGNRNEVKTRKKRRKFGRFSWWLHWQKKNDGKHRRRRWAEWKKKLVDVVFGDRNK